MLEIISLFVLQGVIANMARRRDRTPMVFRVMLFLCWFCGEFAGGGAGYLLAQVMGSQNFFAWIVSGATLGAAFGATTAFVWAKGQSPLNGEWRDLSEVSAGKSKLAGAIGGGLSGMLIGAGVVAFGHRVDNRQNARVERHAQAVHRRH
jgi:hypothetical protein